MSDNVYAHWMGRDATEQQRMDQQFQIISSALGWHVHPAVHAQLPASPAIADIATGTGAFLRAMAEQYPNAARLDGYDVSPAMFPPADSLPAAIKLDLGDAKQPFPTSLHSRYDLVHVQYMIAAMEPSDWAPALQNLLALVKPGGYIQWTEPALSQVQFPRGLPTSKTGTLERLSAVFKEGPIEQRFANGWNALPRLMREAGLRVETDVVSSDRVPETRRALTDNSAVLLFTFAKAMSAKGAPGAMTAEELKQAEESAHAETASGCYVRYDVHTAVGWKSSA